MILTGKAKSNKIKFIMVLNFAPICGSIPISGENRFVQYWFQVLYLLITFGSGTDEQISLDPPDHLLRVRLVCTILDTCGCYFNTGSNKKKLDYFLIYFQVKSGPRGHSSKV